MVLQISKGALFPFQETFLLPYQEAQQPQQQLVGFILCSYLFEKPMWLFQCVTLV